jgi:hypothetical protein
MKKHVSFTKVVSEIAEGGWGQKFESMEDAEKYLIEKPAELAAYASAELLRRLSAFAGQQDSEEQGRPVERPDNVKLFPGKSIGDFLYSFDIDSGISRCLIVGKDRDDAAIVISTPVASGDCPWLFYAAGDYLFSTEAEAMAGDCKSNLSYYESRFHFLRQIQTALASGGDLSEFAKGLQEDDESA